MAEQRTEPVPAPAPARPFLTVADVAARTGRGRDFVRALVRAGHLRQLNPGSSRPQFDPKAVEYLLERFRKVGIPVFRREDLRSLRRPRARKPAA